LNHFTDRQITAKTHALFEETLETEEAAS
jgi:hypothetical protein